MKLLLFKFMSLFIKCSSRVSEFALALASALMLFLILLTTEQVISRYLFSSSSIALQELQWYLFGLIFLLAMPATLLRDQHVRVDIFYSKAKRRTKALIDCLGTAALLIPSTLVIIFYGIDFVDAALQFQNPRTSDYYTQQLMSQEALLYPMSNTLEGFVREYLLLGEISANPGGLEARWLIKAAIPFSFLLLLIQSIAFLLQSLQALFNMERS